MVIWLLLCVPTDIYMHLNSFEKNMILFLGFLCLAGCSQKDPGEKQYVDRPQLSGIYPHLAFYNLGDECGTGAVVPWQGDLWTITYSPHEPEGSSDRLYQISPTLDLTVREESIGGTPANRMIHRESNQLFMGPYAIDRHKKVRAIPYSTMTGRHTGNARHLSDPENRIYFATMEEGFYEVDVHNLNVETLVEDAHLLPEEEYGSFLPGAHGKGLYSGQGVLVYSNNGERGEKALKYFDTESGALVEWDGTDWRVVRRNQFVEVTGPGGILGNSNPRSDPIWATGWDHRSLLLACREAESGQWEFFRLPKASHSYDGAHGWNTEWPRIRNVGIKGKPDYLMTMHGMFWKFPGSFSSGNTAGIRPRSAYLKVIGDFARWNGKLVMGCDDSARREFLNKRKVKGKIHGPGQSNSNLWFIEPDTPDQLGPATSSGAVWLDEYVKANQVSEPFLFAGWSHRTCWISHDSEQTLTVEFELDPGGEGNWRTMRIVNVAPGEATLVHFTSGEKGEWVRLRISQSAKVTAQFCYTDQDNREDKPEELFDGLSESQNPASLGGLLYGLGEDRRRLGMASVAFNAGEKSPGGYYELTEDLELLPVQDDHTEEFIRKTFAIPRDVITIEPASILVIDDSGRRWRLPRSNGELDRGTAEGHLRIAREVATERDLFSCSGTFYELPAENADGFAKIRPVASHPFRIHDYASYRGLLIMSGIDPEYRGNNPHIIYAPDRKAAVWAGTIDDLWKLGKPTGHGGPWIDTHVEAGELSDPYLIGFYDHRILEINHDSEVPVSVEIQVDPVGHGPWMNYKKVTIQPGETYSHTFPAHFQARWIRFKSLDSAIITTRLDYQ